MQPSSMLVPDPPAVSGSPPAPSPVSGAASLVAPHLGLTRPRCADAIQSDLPIGQQNSAPLLLPLTSSSNTSTTTPTMPCSPAAQEPDYVLLQTVWFPSAPRFTTTSQHALGPELHKPINAEQQEQSVREPYSLSEKEVKSKLRKEEEEESSASTLSPLSCTGDKEEEREEQDWTLMAVGLNGEKEDGNPERHEVQEKAEDKEDRQVDKTRGEREGQGEQGSEEEDRRDTGGGERKGNGDKDHQGEDEEEDDEEEEEEEEDFDDLTQDEDEEEVMSSASEESVLSIPELQVNRKLSA